MSTGSILSQTKLADIPSFQMVRSTTPLLEIGTRLLDRFELQQEIGAGGMGRVYGAYDWLRESHVAIKVLSDAMLAHPEARERFMREAQTTLQLTHPNIVRVFDIQQDQGMVFLVMELLRGYTLREWINSYRAAGAQFSVDEVKRVGAAVCAALDTAHQITIHRDIKPENLFINADDSIKLMDFGIARDLNRSSMANTTMAIGTLHYMAPEQASGSHQISGRADIYALGIVLYEMLTGTVPMGMAQPITSLRPDVPSRLARVIEKALLHLPEQRYASASEFGAALASGKVPGESVWTSLLSMADGKGKWLAGAGAVAVAGAVLLAVATKGDGLFDGLEDLVPLFGQKAEALQEKVIAQSMEVKDLRKKMDALQNAATRNPKSEASRNLGVFIENSIFPSGVRSQLDARIELAGLAMREKSFKKAQRLLEEPAAILQRTMKTASIASDMLVQTEELQKLEKLTGSRLSGPAQQAADGFRTGSIFAAATGNAATDDIQAQKIADAASKIQEDMQRLKNLSATQASSAQAAAAQAANDRRKREEEARQRQMEEDRRQAEARQRQMDEDRRQAQQRQEERQRQTDAARQRDEQARAQQQAQQRAAREQQEAQMQAACETARTEAKAAAIVGTLAAFTCRNAANSTACFEQAQAGLNTAQAKINRFCR